MLPVTLGSSLLSPALVSTLTMVDWAALGGLAVSGLVGFVCRTLALRLVAPRQTRCKNCQLFLLLVVTKLSRADKTSMFYSLVQPGVRPGHVGAGVRLHGGGDAGEDRPGSALHPGRDPHLWRGARHGGAQQAQSGLLQEPDQAGSAIAV